MTETLESAYRTHADQLVRFATTMIGPDRARDVVVDALVAVFAPDGEGARPTAGDLRAYLYRAVRNRIIDVERSRSRRGRREIAYELRQRRDPAGFAAADAGAHEARAALSHLSEQQRTVTFLTYWSDMTPDQIAEVLDVSTGTVKKQLARARARLQEVLDV